MDSQNTPFIQVKDLSFSYAGEEGEEIRVLDHLNLSIEKGAYVAILGHNGSGKSTLAKLLNMILSPSAGQIFIDGVDTSSPDMTEEQMIEIRRKIGMVFQNPDNQLVATVVEEDIAFGAENLGIPPKEIRARVDGALKTVGMEEYAKHSPHQLSGGQKQRIAIAGIIAMLPQCIVFDESTAMLDPMGRKEVVATMEKLNRQQGITVINITHNMDEAARADRVIVVSDGEITYDGTPREVFSCVDGLRKVGLDVPQVTELFHDLRCMGASLPEGILSEAEGADAVLALLSSFEKQKGEGA